MKTDELDISIYYADDNTYKTFDINEKNLALPLDLYDVPDKLGWTRIFNDKATIMIVSNPEQKILFWFPLHFTLLNNLKNNCIDVIFEEKEDGKKYFQDICYTYPEEFETLEEKDAFFDTVSNIFLETKEQIIKIGELL